MLTIFSAETARKEFTKFSHNFLPKTFLAPWRNWFIEDYPKLFRLEGDKFSFNVRKKTHFMSFFLKVFLLRHRMQLSWQLENTFAYSRENFNILQTFFRFSTRCLFLHRRCILDKTASHFLAQSLENSGEQKAQKPSRKWNFYYNIFSPKCSLGHAECNILATCRDVFLEVQKNSDPFKNLSWFRCPQ